MNRKIVDTVLPLLFHLNHQPITPDSSPSIHTSPHQHHTPVNLFDFCRCKSFSIAYSSARLTFLNHDVFGIEVSHLCPLTLCRLFRNRFSGAVF